MLAAGLLLPLLTRFLCSPYSEGDTPLIAAARQCDLNMARLLVSAGAVVDLKNHSLSWVVCARATLRPWCTAISRIISSAGLPLPLITGFIHRYFTPRMESPRLIVSPLHCAVVNGDFEMVRFLVGAGADVNAVNW
jgi:ankyrin repeat protein